MSSEIKWIKLSTDVFNNRKIKQIEQMPDGDSLIVIWIKLLVLAGKTNHDGTVYFTEDIPYTDQLLSVQFGRPLSTIQLALSTFVRFGMIEIVNDLIMVSNWEKYQSVDGMDKIREQNRLRKQKSRERQRLLSANHDEASRDGHVTVTQNSNSISNKSSSQSLSQNKDDKGKDTGIQCRMFEQFYDAYGNKKGKKNAEKAFAKINPDEELFKQIMDGVERYHQSRNWREGYRKEPATWLNGECWNDDYSNEKAPGKSVNATQYAQRDYTENDLGNDDDLIAEAKRLRGGES